MRPWREVLISRTAALARLMASFLAPPVEKESFQRA
jgi:hypothetical protein